MGFLYLNQGNLKEARQHAVWALQMRPEDTGAMRLIVGIKANQSKLLGLYWRFSMTLMRLDQKKTVAAMVTAFVLYQSLDIIFRELEWHDLTTGLTTAWLAFCAYTWVAPTLFERALKKELDPVNLKDDF